MLILVDFFSPVSVVGALLIRCDRMESMENVCVFALLCQSILNNDYRMHHFYIEQKTV